MLFRSVATSWSTFARPYVCKKKNQYHLFSLITYPRTMSASSYDISRKDSRTNLQHTFLSDPGLLVRSMGKVNRTIMTQPGYKWVLPPTPLYKLYKNADVFLHDGVPNLAIITSEPKSFRECFKLWKLGRLAEFPLADLSATLVLVVCFFTNSFCIIRDISCKTVWFCRLHFRPSRPHRPRFSSRKTFCNAFAPFCFCSGSRVAPLNEKVKTLPIVIRYHFFDYHNFHYCIQQG